MHAMRSTLSLCLLATGLLFTGCGKQAHRDAVALGEILEKNQSGYNNSNGMERDLIAGTRAWTETIMTRGAGRGLELTQNARVAQQLAKSADLISAQLGEFRKSLYDQPLQQETLQTMRTAINAQITKRQKFLQEIRIVLVDTETQFRELTVRLTYRGDTYSVGIDRLAELVQPYHYPEDIVLHTLQSLRLDYGIFGTSEGI
jgi:hypothetical protein